MVDPNAWTKEAYETSTTSTVWWYTPYDRDDPGSWDNVSRDAEMREIFAMEQALPKVSAWARAVGIDYMPPCGHYTFPAPYLQVLDLIGAADQQAVDAAVTIRCYTADRARKRTAQDIGLCLDAWLAGAAPEAPAAELNLLGSRKLDWPAACSGLWEMLGERTEKKTLLVERLLYALRHAIKARRWDGDDAAEFGRDAYLGDLRRADGHTSFDVFANPRVQAIHHRLSELHPGYFSLFKVDLGHWWLCAPNAFRLLEYDLWAIGHDRQAGPGDSVPKYLQSEATCPNRQEAADWWPPFLAALDAWWREHPVSGPVTDDVNRRLGESTPVKRWLVRLFLRKLRMLASYKGEGVSKLVGELADC